MRNTVFYWFFSLLLMLLPQHTNKMDSFSSTPLPSQEPGPPQFSTPTQQPRQRLSFSEQIQLAAANRQQNKP